MRALLLLLAAGTAALAADPEILREEALNFRVRGTLPQSWVRREGTMHFVFRIDGIAHAHVQIVAERLAKDAVVDVEEQIRRRAEHYRFPGAPADAAEKTGEASWGGAGGRSYEHEVTLGGTLCRRRVTAVFAKATWYERIETIYGEGTEEEPTCAQGLRTLRDGFSLLVAPLPPEASAAEAETTIESEEFGFRITKPAGFRRVDVDPGTDPGIRVAFERTGPERNQHLRVRLFEYGIREGFDPAKWMDVFYGSFATDHSEPAREAVSPPMIPGAKRVTATRLRGKRDGFQIETLILLVESPSDRILALRIRSQHGADPPPAAILSVQ